MKYFDFNYHIMIKVALFKESNNANINFKKNFSNNNKPIINKIFKISKLNALCIIFLFDVRALKNFNKKINYFLNCLFWILVILLHYQRVNLIELINFNF